MREYADRLFHRLLAAAEKTANELGVMEDKSPDSAKSGRKRTQVGATNRSSGLSSRAVGNASHGGDGHDRSQGSPPANGSGPRSASTAHGSSRSTSTLLSTSRRRNLVRELFLEWRCGDKWFLGNMSTIRSKVHHPTAGRFSALSQRRVFHNGTPIFVKLHRQLGRADERHVLAMFVCTFFRHIYMFLPWRQLRVELPPGLTFRQ